MALNFDTDNGFATRATLGVIVLQTDETLEPELARIMALDGVALYHSRIPMRPEVTADTLAEMRTNLPAAARLFPGSLNFDVIGYGCTSAATIIGPREVERAVQEVLPNVQVANPISAVIAACKSLNATRIGFVTPYVAEVSAAMRAMLESHGIKIAGFASFEEGDDRTVARITPDSSLAAITHVASQADCDLVFVSCTSLRIAGIVETAEKQIGMPVISSNTALAWHMLRLAGIDDRIDGFGHLLRLPLIQ